MDKRATIVVRLLLVLAIGALCWRLGGYALLEPDEGRNAEVAREMARGGDWVLPHLNGLPYLDKPAPYFAAVAVGMKVFGESEGAARAASLGFTLVSLLLVYLLARRAAPAPAGELSALALATMPLALVFSRTIIFDPALACIETAALYAAWRALEGGPSPGRWAALAWAALGVGAITKGPVALIVPLLVLAGFALLAGVSLRPVFRWYAWPCFLVTGLPWFLAVVARRPDFPRYAFIYESLQRMATKTHGRAGQNWYFIPIALAGTFPWAAPALAEAAAAWRRRAERRAPESRFPAFLVAWAIVPLVFFSISQSKLPGYYLPALPAWALCCGCALARCAEDADVRRRMMRSATVAGVIVLVLAAAMFVAAMLPAPHKLTPDERTALPGFALAFGAVLVVAGALAIGGARRAHLGTVVAALALPTMAIPVVGAGLLHAVGLQRSSIAMAEAIERAAPGALVVGANAYPTSLRYYLDRPVVLATAGGAEMTSNYVVSRLEEFRALEGSPLRPGDWWRTALQECTRPTVFITRRGTGPDSALAQRLPLIATGGADARYAAWGPCLNATR